MVHRRLSAVNKKTVFTIIFTLMILLLTCLSGCSSAKQEIISSVPEKSLEGSNHLEPTTNKDVSMKELSKMEDRKIIQTATISLSTDNLKHTEEKMIAIINANQGRADEINVTHDDNNGQSKGLYTLRVPQEKLTQVIDSIVNLPDVVVQQKKTSSQDITEEYIDIDARSENLKHQEKRLQELLSKTNSVDEMLKVENELMRVRTQIDSALGKMKKMSSLVTMSTIKVTVTENGVIPKNSFIYKIKSSFSDSFQMAGDVIIGIIMFTIGFSPLAIFIMIAIFIYRRIKAGKKKMDKEEK